MELFAFTFAGFAATFGAMALGVLIGRAPLRRGCGDPGSEACETCTRPCARRRARSDETP